MIKFEGGQCLKCGFSCNDVIAYQQHISDCYGLNIGGQQPAQTIRGTASGTAALECKKCGVVPNPGCLCTGGYKADHDKPDLSLLSGPALIKMAKVMTYGKKKYTANNWRTGMVWTRPVAASLRHTFAWLSGETNDPETGINHLAHAACNLMFALEFEDTHPDKDDRWKS